MKIRNTFVVTIAAALLSAFNAKADQLQLLSHPESVIKSMADFLKTQKQLVLWCACCDGDEKKLITVKNAGYRHEGGGSYTIFIEDTTGTIHNAVDLAYVHFFRDDGMAYNVGNEVWSPGSCNPCTEPFFMPGMIGGPLETAQFGGKHWMKRNLNVETANSWCYGNDPKNCDRFGRLYTWDAAVKACADLGDGWRLPNNSDWSAMTSTTSRTDFPVQSGGFYNRDTSGYNSANKGFFHGEGFYGMWWSATTIDAGNGAEYWDIHFKNGGSSMNISNYTGNGMSVRCVRDDEFTQTAPAAAAVVPVAQPRPVIQEAPPQPEPATLAVAPAEDDDIDDAPAVGVARAHSRRTGSAAVAYDRSGTAARIGDFVAEPNPVGRHSRRPVVFYIEGMEVRSWMLSVYDSRSQLVTRFTSNAPTAEWDLTDSRGRTVVAGRYEIRGSAQLANGRRESVSVMVSVR